MWTWPQTCQAVNCYSRSTRFHPSSIYSCSIDHILEQEFCRLGCWAVSGKFLKRRNFCLSMQLFGVVFSCFDGQFLEYFFLDKKLKKSPQKVAYLSRNSVVSEIFLLLPNSPNGRIHVPKCGL